MNAAQRIQKAKLSAVIDRAWDDESVIDSMSGAQLKHLCHVFLQAYKGVVYESSLTKDMVRHLEVEEIRIEALQRADVAVESARIERQRFEDADKLAREAIDLREAMRCERDEARAELQSVRAELEGTQSLLKLAGDHPDYAGLLQCYKRLLARLLERGWDRLTG